LLLGLAALDPTYVPPACSWSRSATSATIFAGSHIEFWVKQTTSSKNFATPVEYAYQFVVESQ
jgi:hypothetical protein